MIDPVIKGLSLESPCRPSLGTALLINPERCTNINILFKRKEKVWVTLLNTHELPSNGGPSLPECALLMGPSIMSYVRLSVFSLEFLMAFGKNKSY